MAAGDALARGGVRAQFPPAGGNVSQAKWDEIFKDYVPESEKNNAGEEALSEEQKEIHKTS